MNPISITVTGRLGDDPRTFTTRDGTDGVELRLALDLPVPRLRRGRHPVGEGHRVRAAGHPHRASRSARATGSPSWPMT